MGAMGRLPQLLVAKIHDYLGMTFDFSEEGKVNIDMIDYMEAMVDDFSAKFKASDTAPSPAAEDLFAEGMAVTLTSNDWKNFIRSLLKACSLASEHVLIYTQRLQC
jgi:hypothetical protein